MILDAVAEQLQAFYRLDRLPPPDPFLIDAPTVARLASPSQVIDARVSELLLVRSDGAELEVALYIAPQVLQALRKDNPFLRLHDGNLAPFCVVVEGMSHFVCVLWKFCNNIAVSRLELELQAEVDKFLCCTWLQQAQDTAPLPLHERLFVNYAIAEGRTGEETRRYHLASMMAERFCEGVDRRYLRRHRLGAFHRMLPAFYRLSHWEKLRLLR